MKKTKLTSKQKETIMEAATCIIPTFSKEEVIKFGNYLLSNYRASITSESCQQLVTDADFANCFGDKING